MKSDTQSLKKFKKAPLLVSAVFLIFSCLIFLFLYKKIDDNRKMSEKAKIEWQIEATRREEIRSLERSIRAIEKERNLLESHFARSSNVVPFLNTIERLALAANLKSEIISVDILKDRNGLAVAVKTSGSFESIYKFLTLLENSPYELEFPSADIKNTGALIVSGKKNRTPRWEANFKINLLSFVQ